MYKYLQGLHLCSNGKELCDGERTSPDGHPVPTVTTARGHWNETKMTVTTEYNSRQNLECCWFLKVTLKRLAYPVHKNFPIS